jgi:hypothetical protein
MRCYHRRSRIAVDVPELILTEDSRNAWRIDLFAVLETNGYAVLTRSMQNVTLRQCTSW